MSWHWLQFSKPERYVLNHAASDATKSAVIASLERRGCALHSAEVLEDLYFDQPGMMAVNRPNECFELDGLRLEIPSEDVASFSIALTQIECRRFGDIEFYKLHGFHRCLCLSVDEHGLLLAMLKDRTETAERRAAEFYATVPLPADVLRMAAAHATGQPIEEIPFLGGAKQERFRLKKGGEA